MKRVRIRKQELIWDDWNSKHIKKHNVTQTEIEEALGENARVKSSYKGRIMAFGKTKSEKILAIVLDRKHNGYYVITSRHASRKERKYL